MNRERVTCMLVADGDAMVRGKMCSFLWAPQAEIEVMSLRSGLSGFDEEIVVRRPVFVLEKLVSEVKRQGMCVKRDGGQGFLFARSGERVKVLRGPNPTPGDGEVLKGLGLPKEWGGQKTSVEVDTNMTAKRDAGA